MRVTKFVAGAALTLTVLAAGAWAAENAGEVKALLGGASAADRVLAPGSGIVAGELVKTSLRGQAQIEFAEGSRMVVGAQSVVKINAFELKGDGGAAKLDIQADDGTFRFISDGAGDTAYAIRTPTATIALSGTAFDFTVTKSRGTRLLLLEGEVTMCGTEDESACVTVATPCAMLRTDDGKKVEPVGSVAGSRTGEGADEVAATEVGLEEEIREHFPYQQSQSDLLEDFQVAGRPCTEGGLSPQPLAAAGLKVPPEAIVPLVLIPLCVFVVCKSKNPDTPNHTN